MANEELHEVALAGHDLGIVGLDAVDPLGARARRHGSVLYHVQDPRRRPSHRHPAAEVIQGAVGPGDEILWGQDAHASSLGMVF